VVRWPDLGADTTLYGRLTRWVQLRLRERVTFLFTDIEGSTRLWEENRAAMSEVLARHRAAGNVGPPRASGDSIVNHGRLAAEDREKCSLGLLLDFLTLRAGPRPNFGGKPPVRWIRATR